MSRGPRAEALKSVAERIKLTHYEGVGEVVIYAPVGPLGQWLERYWGFLLLAFGFIALFFVMHYLSEVRPQLAKRAASQAAEGQQQAGELQPKTGEQLKKGD